MVEKKTEHFDCHTHNDSAVFKTWNANRTQGGKCLEAPPLLLEPSLRAIPSFVYVRWSFRANNFYNSENFIGAAWVPL